MGEVLLARVMRKLTKLVSGVYNVGACYIGCVANRAYKALIFASDIRASCALERLKIGTVRYYRRVCVLAIAHAVFIYNFFDIRVL